jgi:SAM-dependent methyltransferase
MTRTGQLGGRRGRRAQNPAADVWDTYWLRVQEHGYRRFNQGLVEALVAVADVEGKRILEAGGAGGNSQALARLGAHPTLVDFSAAALRIASKLASDGSFSCSQADVYRLPFADEVFDIVFHQGLLEHFSDPDPVLQEQFRILRPDGLLLVDVPQRLNWYAVEKRIRMRTGPWTCGWETDFTYPQLHNLLRSQGFEPIHAYARQYHPRLLRAVRHLRRIESKMDRRVLPARVWEGYERLWGLFESSRLALYVLKCIGIVARKVPDGRAP